jgi:hypothetical protein
MRRTFAAAVAAFMLAAVPAEAAPTWMPTGTLAPDGATAPIAGLGANGDAVVAWLRAGTLEARVRAPGAAFADVQPIAAGATGHDVAVGEDGTAVLAWGQADGVWVAVRPPGGAFSAQPLAGGAAPSRIDVAVNARGDVLVAFARDGAWASLRPAGGAFEAPVQLRAGDACDIQAAVGDGGDAAVAWHDLCAGVGAAHVARRPAGGAFAAEQALGPTSSVDVAVTSDGVTGVVLDGAPVNVAARDGSFTAAGPAAGSSGAIAAGGATLAAVWLSGGRVVAAQRPAGGTFGSLGELSAGGAKTPAVGAGPDGRISAVWLRAAEGGDVLEGAHRPAGGAFAHAVPVASGGATAFALDGDGNAFAAAGLAGHVLDAAGPRLLIEGRSAGFAEETYGFAVTATDAWSTVTGTAFDFGDGTTAPGPVAAHAYATPGRRVITATGTDANGNTSVLATPIDIAPALDRKPPVLTKVSMDARKFRISSKPTPVAIISAVRRGTRFRYTLSEPAHATILFERVTTGRKKGKRCVRGKRPKRKRKRCSLYQPAGLITREHPIAGPVSVGFTGRIVAGDGPIKVADARLRPGRYRASIVAADDSRNASKPKRLSFRIVR